MSLTAAPATRMPKAPVVRTLRLPPVICRSSAWAVRMRTPSTVGTTKSGMSTPASSMPLAIEWLANSLIAGASSNLTRFQSASSSSASICASAVPAPWPISEWGTMAVTTLLLSSLTQVWSSVSPSSVTCLVSWLARLPGRIATPTTSPPPAITPALINPRRVHLPTGHLLNNISNNRCGFKLLHPSCGLDGFADTVIHTTAANVARHSGINIGI